MEVEVQSAKQLDDTGVPIRASDGKGVLFDGRNVVLTHHALEQFQRRFGSPHAPRNWQATMLTILGKASLGLSRVDYPQARYEYQDWTFVISFEEDNTKILVVTCWRAERGRHRSRPKYRQFRTRIDRKAMAYSKY